MLGSMMRRAMIGDDAKLSLDFTSTLPAGVTFTRAANTATRINSSGLVETMSADQPRFDYDPATRAPRALLIEGSAVNLALYSQSFTSGIGWFFGGTGTKSTTNNYATAPDGTTTAARLQLGQNCAIKQNAGTTGVNHTVSIWVKSNTGSNQTIAFWTGTAAANRTATTSWTRIEAVVNNASAALFDLYNPNASDCDILIWGAQLETGSGASSYIPTGASQATRNPDICTISGAAFSSWYNASEGTFFAHFRRRRTNNTGTVLSANDNTTAEVIDLCADTVGTFKITDGGSSQVSLFRSPFSANTDTKIAGAFKLNDCNMAMANSIAGGDATATIPTVDRLFIGRDSGAVPVYLDGHIKTIKFYDIRKDDGKLQEMTA